MLFCFYKYLYHFFAISCILFILMLLAFLKPPKKKIVVFHKVVAVVDLLS